jgi:hypothetical protein
MTSTEVQAGSWEEVQWTRAQVKTLAIVFVMFVLLLGTTTVTLMVP